MRSNIAWIGLSLFSLLGVAAFTACSGSTDSPVGSAYPFTGKQCATPGETAAAADGCNDCTCGSDGTWSCTDVACSPGAGGACEPGDTKNVDCNRCQCQEDGTWDCEEQNCSQAGLCNPVGTGFGLVCSDLPLPSSCKEGDTMPHRCNTCTCDAAGDWSCTDMACSPQCTPGESEWNASGCDGCDCNAEGFWECYFSVCTPPATSCPAGVSKYELGCMTCECGDTERECNFDACEVYN